MSNYKNSAALKIERNLFKSEKDLKEPFSERELERKHRVMLCVSKKLEDPLILDKTLVDFLMNGCEGACKDVSETTAYRDIALVTNITGKIKLATKDWNRYMIIEAAKRAAAKADEAGDYKAVASNLTVIMKTSKADQDDDIDIHSVMTPPNFEPSADPLTLGDDVEVIPNLEEERKRLRELFHSKAKEKVYTDYIEIKDESPAI